MEKKRTVAFRRWRKTKAGYLRWMLDRYVELGQDPAFITDCKNFYRVDIDTLIEKQHIVEALANEFFVKWGVFPLPSWLLTDDLFRQTLEEHWKRTGKAIDITITPATTPQELAAKYKEFRRNLRKGRRPPNLSKLRRNLILKYLQDIPPLFMGQVTAGDLALARGSKLKRGRVEYDFEFIHGERTVVLNDTEIDLQEMHYKKLVKNGVEPRLAERRATRMVTKKRWEEAPLAPQIRSSSKRAFKQFLDLIS